MVLSLKAFSEAAPAGKSEPADTVPVWAAGDKGNAAQFANWLAENNPLKYDYTSGNFYIFTGKYYKQDDDGEIERLSDAFLSYWIQRAAGMLPDQRDTILKRLTGLHNRRNKQAMIDEIKHLPGIAAKFEDFNPLGLLAFKNGILDTSTGELMPHNPAHLITHYLDYDFAPETEAPKWLAFQEKVTNGNFELQWTKQRLYGSSLAAFPDRRFIFNYGIGANGKTTETEALAMVLGSAAGTIASEILMVGTSPDRRFQEVLSMRGKLLVTSSEIDQKASWHEQFLKFCTGGDTMKGRAMRQEFEDVKASWLLVINGNYKPAVGGDPAVWQRIVLIPFLYRFSDTEKRPMPEILAEFKEEAAGIFAWLWAGYQAFKRDGVELPPIVKDAIAAYKADSDTIGAWLESNCSVYGGDETSSRDLHKDYQDYCQENGDSVLTIRQFNEELEKRGFRVVMKAGRRKYFEGITLLDKEGSQVLSDY